MHSMKFYYDIFHLGFLCLKMGMPTQCCLRQKNEDKGVSRKVHGQKCNRASRIK